jgi:signal transduction histidine kinase
MKYLFDPFFRADNSVDKPGTGLGLPIVKQSVERHNGEIEVVSKINEGSEFIVRLPLIYFKVNP